jgi:phosphate transport system permease protein
MIKNANKKESKKALRKAKIVASRIRAKRNPFKFRSGTAKHQWLAKRHASEARFKLYGQLAVAFSIVFICYLVYGVLGNGIAAFKQSQIKLTIEVPVATGETYYDERNSYGKAIKAGLLARFPDVKDRRGKRDLKRLLSKASARQAYEAVTKQNAKAGDEIAVWMIAASNIDLLIKGKVDVTVDESLRLVKDISIGWVNDLKAEGAVRTVFNTSFFTNGDSRNPEEAGIATAMLGSFYSIVVCLLIAFPLGVASAIYLQEFAPKNWFTNLVEININNLAAVPSIIFGLIGLAIYLNFFGMPRSSALVGGCTLAMLVLPIIVIATRQALSSVPNSIRDAAVALGATNVQTVFQHVLPYSLSGILTGVVLSVARALGETAPLLMIGMMAFIADTPDGITDPTTSMPIQIYLWADSPELGFAERTSAAILVLLCILVVVNVFAMYLRKRYEVKW